MASVAASVPGRSGAAMARVARRAARLCRLVLLTVLPLALWLGFGDPVEAPKELVLAAVALAWTLAVAADPDRRARWIGSPLAPAALGCAAAAVVAVLASAAPALSWSGEADSWNGGARLVALAALALASAAEGPDRRTAGAAALGGAALVVYAGAQRAGADWIAWNASTRGGYWLFATLGNPVHLAGFLTGLLWISAAAPPRSFAVRWALRLGLAAAVGATRERSAWIGLAAGAFVAAAQGRGRRPRVWAAAAAVALALLVGWAVVGSRGQGGAGGTSALLGGPALSGSRPRIWAGALRLSRRAPLWGVGPDLLYTWFPGVAGYAYYAAEPPAREGTVVSLRLPASAHNLELHVLATQGWIGLGMLAWLLAAVVRAGASSPWLPAAVALWAVEQVNPSSAATAGLWWVVLGAAAAGRGPGEVGVAPVSRNAAPATVLLMVALLLAGVVSAGRVALAEAQRRQVGGLLAARRQPEAVAILTHWSPAAARFHPRTAHADAGWWRAVWEASPGTTAYADAAVACEEAAELANPFNVFYRAGRADLALALAVKGRRREELAVAQTRLREALALAPAAVSLLDDQADVAEAAGDRARAAALRAERRARDPLAIFGPAESGKIPSTTIRSPSHRGARGG